MVGIKINRFKFFKNISLKSWLKIKPQGDASALEHTKIWEIAPNCPNDGSITSNSDLIATKILKLHNETPKEQWVFSVRSGMDQGRQYICVTEKIRIGRQFDNHIQLRDPKISRIHALVFKKGPYLMIRDMQSTNGTKVNNERIYKPQRLNNGDLIQLGDTLIEITLRKD